MAKSRKMQKDGTEIELEKLMKDLERREKKAAKVKKEVKKAEKPPKKAEAKVEKKGEENAGKKAKKEKGPGILSRVFGGKGWKERKNIVKEVEEVEAPGHRKTEFVYKKVGGKIIYLETDVDRLLKIVLERGEVRASELAGIFKVPKLKIEEWGIILEDHKLIEMHYTPFGEPKLMARKPKKNAKSKKKG